MYLDPGFGSMLVQALIASLAAAGVMVGVFWNRIKAFFNRGKNKDDSEKPDDEE